MRDNGENIPVDDGRLEEKPVETTGDATATVVNSVSLFGSSHTSISEAHKRMARMWSAPCEWEFDAFKREAVMWDDLSAGGSIYSTMSMHQYLMYHAEQQWLDFSYNTIIEPKLPKGDDLFLREIDHRYDEMNGFTVFHLIVHYNQLTLAQAFKERYDANEFEKAKLLIALNKADSNGMMPLHYAVLYGRVDMVKWLIGCGVVVDCLNKGGNTPLYLLVTHQMSKHAQEIATLLLEAGANPSVICEDGCTPLFMTVNLHKPELYGLCDRIGVKKFKHPSLQSYTHRVTHDNVLCHILRPPPEESEQDNMQITKKLRLLLGSGFDVNAVGGRGTPALLIAATFNQAENVRLLLQAGADVDAVSWRGHTALCAAINARSYAVAEIILAFRPDPNISRPEDGVTPLHLAAKRGDYHMVDALLNAGADPTLVNSRGCTAKTSAERWLRKAIGQKAAEYRKVIDRLGAALTTYMSAAPSPFRP